MNTGTKACELTLPVNSRKGAAKAVSGRKTMLRHRTLFAAAVILAETVLGLDVPGEPASMAGSWHVDGRRSDAKLVTDDARLRQGQRNTSNRRQ